MSEGLQRIMREPMDFVEDANKRRDQPFDMFPTPRTEEPEKKKEGLGDLAGVIGTTRVAIEQAVDKSRENWLYKSKY